MDLEKVREAAERVARSEGLEIADIEWKVGRDRFLRVYIDRVPGAAPVQLQDANDDAALVEGGESHDVSPYAKISHSDCERVSQQLSVILDVEDLIPGPSYILEVSSPGMDRSLKKPAHFERFKGRMARISTTEPVGNSRNFEGRLRGFSGGDVQLELQGKDAKVVAIPLQMIRKANLVVEF